MESQVKFRWRQRPPKLGYEEYERIAGRMQRCLERELPRRPWRKTLRVRVNADSRAGSDKKAPLVMWVIAPNAIDAFWAASLMGLFHKHVVAANRRIGRIAITAQKEPVSGYAPLISWRFYGSDNRPKTIRDSELHGFVRYLHWCAAAGSKVRGLEKHGTEMLMHIAKSPSIQWEAVHGLAHHAERQGYLTCTAEEALVELAGQPGSVQPKWTGEKTLTRWKAIKTLVDRHLLDGFIGGQQPLRPAGSAARLEDILGFIAAAYRYSTDDLAGPRRQAELMHARYVAAAVMRRATSRSLVEIGRCLGGRDHATIINGLDNIERWRRLDPMHSWIIETLAQIADNLGIEKMPTLRKVAEQQLKEQFTPAHGKNEALPSQFGPKRLGIGSAAPAASAGKTNKVITVSFGATQRGMLRSDR